MPVDLKKFYINCVSKTFYPSVWLCLFYVTNDRNAYRLTSSLSIRRSNWLKVEKYNHSYLIRHCTTKSETFLFRLAVLLGWETNNQYVVKNSLGQQVWLAAEESDFCTRLVCGPVRSFVMHLQDNVGQEVLTLTRPLKCSSCWFPCCLQEVHKEEGYFPPLINRLN